MSCCGEPWRCRQIQKLQKREREREQLFSTVPLMKNSFPVTLEWKDTRNCSYTSKEDSQQRHHFTHPDAHERPLLHICGHTCAHTHTQSQSVSTACPTEGVSVMSQHRYTHQLYSYRTDATYSVNTLLHYVPLSLSILSLFSLPPLPRPPSLPVFSRNSLSLTSYILLLHTASPGHTHTSSKQMSFSTHASINSTFALTPLPVHGR